MNSTAHNHYWASRLTGGSSDALDAIDHSDAGGSGYALQTGDVALVHNSTSKLLYPFKYSSGSTEAENSPNYIKPDSVGAGTGAWEKEKIAKTCVENSTAWDAVITDLVSHSTNPNAHHNESHTIASHSDTTATGAELETLTDDSNADSLHVHAYSVCNLTNKSGDTTTVGYVYRHDPDNDLSADYGSEDEDADVVVAISAIASNSAGNFVNQGYVQIYVNGSQDADISAGIKYLYFSSTPGQAKISSQRNDGCFGEALEDSSGAGLVHAKIYQVPPRHFSWLTEPTETKHVILPVMATAGGDGVQKYGLIIDKGTGAEWDNTAVLHPGCVLFDNLVGTMFTGQDNTYADYRRFKLGVATQLINNIESAHSKYGSNPVASADVATWENAAAASRGLTNPSPIYNPNASNTVATGTATAADATGLTMTDSGATWTINQWAGKYLINLSDSAGGTLRIGGVGRVESNSGTVMQIPNGMTNGAANDWQIGDSYLIVDAKFMAMYVGSAGDAVNVGLGLMYSFDFFTWVKISSSNPVIFQTFGDALHQYPSISIIKLGDLYFLFYKNAAGEISCAYSATEMYSWVNLGTVLTLGAGGTWNANALGDYKSVEIKGNIFSTFFGFGAGGALTSQVGMALSSVKDLLSGTITASEYFLNPIMYTSNPGTGTQDDGAHFGPDLFYIRDTLWMEYGALDSGTSARRIFLAGIKNVRFE